MHSPFSRTAETARSAAEALKPDIAVSLQAGIALQASPELLVHSTVPFSHLPVFLWKTNCGHEQQIVANDIEMYVDLARRFVRTAWC